MLMIQGSVKREEFRLVKEKDQVNVNIQGNDHIGVVELVSRTERSACFIINGKDFQIHASLLTDELGYVSEDYKLFKSNGVFHFDDSGVLFYRQVRLGLSYKIDYNSKLEFYTNEIKTIKEERPLTVEDKLKYVNDGCMYDILYISPEGNMIVKEQHSGNERVVNKKDRQLQIALGIRNA